MSYRIAGIDVPKKGSAKGLCAEVVSNVEIESEFEFERRTFGDNPEQLQSLNCYDFCMVPRKRIALVVMILAACVGCDQRTKFLAGEHLRGSDGISFLADTVRLDYTENRGAFLGLGTFLPAPWRAAVFTVGCSVAVASILSYALVASRAGYLCVFGLSLICGGGTGNLIDRWSYGYTRDFLNLGLGPVRTGIFNLADVALMMGCLLVLLAQRTRTSPECGFR